MAIKTDLNMEQAILKAANKLFLEKGFAATSTTEIAREAGCNQALVHYYYRTKDRLFEAIFEKKIKFFISSLLKIDEEDIPFKDKLTKKIESHFEVIRENPKLPLFFVNELNSNPERLSTLRTKLKELSGKALQQFEAELKEEINQGRIRPISLFDLLLTMASLNIMVFIGEPIFKNITKINDKDYLKLVEHRKKENIRIILNSLIPEK